MPEYCFICDSCQFTSTDIRPMSRSDDSMICSDCGAPMRRDFGFEKVHASSDSYQRSIISDSLAMHPDQIPEHNRMFPDVKVHKDGRPEFTNYKQHQTYLEKTGFVKMPGKKRRGKRIKSA